MKLIAVNTQEKHDALMRELEAQGCRWLDGKLPSEAAEAWIPFEARTVICVEDGILTHSYREYFEKNYPDVEIIDYEIEPKKPTAPKCFDDWYKAYATESDADKIFMLVLDYFNYNIDSELVTWLDGNKETAINAILNGYEVEEEPLYYVKLPNAAAPYLHQHIDSGNVYFLKGMHAQEGIRKCKFTESEIKAIDPWYFEKAVPVEEGE